MNQQEELHTLIRSSELSEREATAFIAILKAAPDEEIESLVALLQEDTGWALRLYENYKEKVQAFKTKDDAELQNILEKEEGLLKTA